MNPNTRTTRAGLAAVGHGHAAGARDGGTTRIMSTRRPAATEIAALYEQIAATEARLAHLERESAAINAGWLRDEETDAARPAARTWETAGPDTVERAADIAEVVPPAVQRIVQHQTRPPTPKTYPQPKQKARQGARARRSH